MTTVVVLVCVLILIVLVTIVWGSYRDTIKEQRQTITTLKQENDELRKKYNETLSLLQRWQRQKALKATKTADALEEVRASPNGQN